MRRRTAETARSTALILRLPPLVFADPFALSLQDRIEGGEARWQTIGLVEGRLLLLVAHTILDETQDESIEGIRIISARKTARNERRRYEDEIR